MSESVDQHEAGWDGRDRRGAVRLAAEASVRVYVLDEHGQPVAKLIGAELVDVSATGLSVSSAMGAPGGARLRVVPEDGPTVEARVVAVSAWFEQGYRMHCRVESGQVPAKWVAGWTRRAA